MADEKAGRKIQFPERFSFGQNKEIKGGLRASFMDSFPADVGQSPGCVSPHPHLSGAGDAGSEQREGSAPPGVPQHR